eukprot:6768455-Pyramimonas_sp.AAC.1
MAVEARSAPASLVAHLARAGGGLNIDEQVTVPRFVGPGSFGGSRCFAGPARQLPGSARARAKYLWRDVSWG